MRFPCSSRLKACIFLLILVALFSNLLLNLQFPKNQIAFYPTLIIKDRITLYEMRFDRLKKLLSPHAVVGYTTDQDLASPQGIKEYELTQYALSPVLVVRNTTRPLVVGNFHERHLNLHKFAVQQLIPVEDFGNGVILFRRTER